MDLAPWLNDVNDFAPLTGNIWGKTKKKYPKNAQDITEFNRVCYIFTDAVHLSLYIGQISHRHGIVYNGLSTRKCLNRELAFSEFYVQKSPRHSTLGPKDKMMQYTRASLSLFDISQPPNTLTQAHLRPCYRSALVFSVPHGWLSRFVWPLLFSHVSLPVKGPALGRGLEGSSA